MDAVEEAGTGRSQGETLSQKVIALNGFSISLFRSLSIFFIFFGSLDDGTARLFVSDERGNFMPHCNTLEVGHSFEWSY